MESVSVLALWIMLILTLQRQLHKMVKHTETIRREIADELFEYVWPFCRVGILFNKAKPPNTWKS